MTDRKYFLSIINFDVGGSPAYHVTDILAGCNLIGHLIGHTSPKGGQIRADVGSPAR